MIKCFSVRCWGARGGSELSSQGGRIDRFSYSEIYARSKIIIIHLFLCLIEQLPILVFFYLEILLLGL